MNATRIITNIATSGLGRIGDPEKARKIILLNIVCLTGVVFLFPLGVLAHFQGNAWLCVSDLCMGLILICNLLYLRKTGNYAIVTFISLLFITILFLYALVTGGVNNSAFVWYYTYPLFALFLMGTRKGTLAVMALFLPAVIFFIARPTSPFFATYSDELVIRFIPSFLVVFAYAFVFEHMRATSQKRLSLKNVQLEDIISELTATKNSLVKAQSDLEHKVEERTVELRQSYEKLQLEVIRKELMELDLKLANERFMTVLNSLDAHIYVADLETHEILFMNQKMKEDFKQDFTGRTCTDAFIDEARPCRYCDKDRLLDSKGEPGGVVFWEGKNSITQKYYNHYDRAIRWVDGRLVRLQIATDITKIKLLELERLKSAAQLRQAQKMESLGTLAGGIAHDFNNILSAIIGFAELTLFDTDRKSESYHYVQEILEAGNRAKDLVKQILTFSRQTESERKPIKVPPLVEEVVRLLRSTLPTTIQIRKSIESKLGNILADPTQIHQILMNLCTNAAHAIGDQNGIIDIAVTRCELTQSKTKIHPDIDSGVYVGIKVTDTGEGMSAKVMENIFDPYFTTKQKGKGTGLGLAVVHGIVKSYGGAITVESKTGQGTSFTVYIPIINKCVESGIQMQESLPSGIERILLVDDERSLIKLGKQWLERLGYTVSTVDGGVEALALFKSEPNRFDLVITDLTMPRMPGDILAGEIKRIRPELPVILCTGFSERISKDKLEEIGIKKLVLKPIVWHELAVDIRKTLDT